MVYLAKSEPRRDMRGTVACGQTVSAVPMPHDAAFEHELETAFVFCHSGETYPKSFQSEKTKRGHYV